MDEKVAKKLTTALDDHTAALKAHTKALEDSNKLTRQLLGLSRPKGPRPQTPVSPGPEPPQPVHSGPFVDPLTQFLAGG